MIMTKYGFDFPSSIRKTFVNDLEDNWYIPLLSEKKGIPIQSIKRSNFGQYSMAVNYLTSVLEEASAINKVAIYNIDHMAQIRFWGKDAANLLNRTLGANFVDMKIGTCKYTLLLNEKGGGISRSGSSPGQPYSSWRCCRPCPMPCRFSPHPSSPGSPPIGSFSASGMSFLEWAAQPHSTKLF